MSTNISMLGLNGFATAVAGGIILTLSIIEFAGGTSACHGHNWYGSMIAGVLGLVTFVTIPLDLIGTLLIALGEGQFDHTREIEMIEENHESFG